MITGYAEYTKRTAHENDRFLDTTRVFRVLSNATRVSILSLLTNGPMSASEILEKINIAPTILFQHLRVLVNSGLVNTGREGRQAYYFINEEGSENALSQLRELTTVVAGQAGS